MVKSIAKQCVGCAVGGYYTALAIDRVLPILHTGPGCVATAQQFMGTINGAQSGVYFNEGMLPCSNLGESDVVFGGLDNLKKVIESSRKTFDADLLVVLSGCISEIVGDDLQEVKKQFPDSDIVIAETAGFKGTNLYGHSQVLKAIIEQYLEPSGHINQKQVNVWGIIPYYDPFWSGTYDAIEKMLTEIGLEPNIIYGPGRGIQNVRKIPQAAFNLVLSPWWDLDAAKFLEQKFSTPFFHYPVFPVGPTETGKFLRSIAEYAELDKGLVERYIEKKEAVYYYYIERSLNWLYDGRRLPKHFTTVSNSVYSLGLSKYLVNDLGLLPDTQYINDGTPEEFQAAIAKEFQNFDSGIKADVKFELDGYAIESALRQHDFDKLPYIIGSTWQSVLASDLNAYLLTVSAPLSDRVILDRNYFGYEGAQRFYEDFYQQISQSVIHKNVPQSADEKDKWHW